MLPKPVVLTERWRCSLWRETISASLYVLPKTERPRRGLGHPTGFSIYHPSEWRRDQPGDVDHRTKRCGGLRAAIHHQVLGLDARKLSSLNGPVDQPCGLSPPMPERFAPGGLVPADDGFRLAGSEGDKARIGRRLAVGGLKSAAFMDKILEIADVDEVDHTLRLSKCLEHRSKRIA